MFPKREESTFYHFPTTRAGTSLLRLFLFSLRRAAGSQSSTRRREMRGKRIHRSFSMKAPKLTRRAVAALAVTFLAAAWAQACSALLWRA